MDTEPQQIDKNIDKISRNLSRSEKLRIGIAATLLLVGFGLAVYGWHRNDDHLYHLGLTLGPAGLIVVVFEYLVRIGLDTRHVQKIVELDRQHAQVLGGIRQDTIKSLEKTAGELRLIATFNLDMGKLGLVGIYANRADAVRFAIFDMIKNEKEAIYIVGSTIFGLSCDVKDGLSQTVHTTEDIIQRIAKRRDEGCEVHILLTDPNRICQRHEQEAPVRSAERGTIASELRDACAILTSNKLADCTKLYDGSPTCFTMVFKGQRRMIVNPYPYQGEAYNSWAIMIEDRENGIYKPFLENHVVGPWNNEKLTRKLTNKVTIDLGAAENEEKKFEVYAEQLKSAEARRKDELLAGQLPD